MDDPRPDSFQARRSLLAGERRPMVQCPALSLESSDRLLPDRVGRCCIGRSVLVRRGRDRLADMVEVDETYIGGEEPGLAGGRARGKKVLTASRSRFGSRKGLAAAACAAGRCVGRVAFDHVEPGATVFTDGCPTGWRSSATSMLDTASGRPGPTGRIPAMPAVTVASLAKRWLLGTHQGRWSPPTWPAT